MKCGYDTCLGSFDMLNSEMKTCLIILYIAPIIYIILGIYLYEVIPQQFGVRKHPLFCIKKLLKRRKKKAIRSRSEDAAEAMHQEEKLDVGSFGSSDEEIIGEQKKVASLDKHERHKYPLIVDNLTKIYINSGKNSKPKKALNNLSLILNNNEIFGLLGPNGAGKTTFFSLLTGIYEPTSGNAWVGAHSIRENIGKVQELIGYCPQFDLLWSDLSVEEHLYFYSKLKNVQSDIIKKV
jgi:ABC-type glutathione transport system ATPase component